MVSKGLGKFAPGCPGRVERAQERELKRETAEMPLVEFQRELTRRGIVVHDDDVGFQAEVANLKD